MTQKSLAVPACLFLFGLWPVAGGAQVRVGFNAEGRRIIYNEAPSQRGVRLSNRLVEVPDSDIQVTIDRHSQIQSLDPKLVRALIQVESGYNHRARSQKGAMGLMQLMPDTVSRYAVEDPYDPEENVRGGTTYLRTLIDRFPGRLDLALAAYNAGPGAVERYSGIPPYPETRDYVTRVLTLYQGGNRGNPLPGFPASGPQAGSSIPGQRKPYIIRNSQNRIVVTTAFDTPR